MEVEIYVSILDPFLLLFGGSKTLVVNIFRFLVVNIFCFRFSRNQYTGVGQIYAVGDCAGGNLATLGQAQAVRAVRSLGGAPWMVMGTGAAGWWVDV